MSTASIEHVALWTKDLERMKAFYSQFFGAEAGQKYINEKRGFESYFLTFQSGARLEIMALPSLRSRTNDGPRAGYAHIAIAVGSREEVDSLTSRLSSHGYSVVSGPRQTGDGYYESVVLDPDGNEVEITV